MRGELLKPSALIGVETGIEIGKHELTLLNSLIYVWQFNAKDSLFDSLGLDYSISLSDLSRLVNIAKANMVKGDYIEEVFKNLYECSISLKNCVLPQVDNDGNLIFEDGALKFNRFAKYETRILSEWGKTEQKGYHSYKFTLTPMIKGLVHYQTLLHKNGIGYAKMNLKLLNTIKSIKAIRLYEMIVKESGRGNSRLFMYYDDMGKLIYVKEKKRINESLKRLIKELAHLVEITRLKAANSDMVCLEFKLLSN